MVEVRRSAARLGFDVPAGPISGMTEIAEPLVSVVLYLCSEAAEVAGPAGRRPGKPARTKTKAGVRTFAPGSPTEWNVGYRMGAALRAARAWKGGEGEPAGERRGPVGHIRRAHFHGYWVGPKAEQRFVLKWLPPIPVNLDNLDDLVPTVRQVK